TPSFKKIDTLLKEWNLGLQDQRKLFLAISNLLKEQKSSAKENFKILTKLSGTGLVHAECIAKIRLMSLVDLASDESTQIPYSVVRDTLQIEDDEVETWVVKAITAKLIDCKIDQMNQVIIVSRCTNRVFGPSQWLALRTKLTNWRGNIANVITTIQADKVKKEGTHLMQESYLTQSYLEYDLSKLVVHSPSSSTSDSSEFNSSLVGSTLNSLTSLLA
nr:eukaryotic translation initiation factor 3 subunit M-like [Tanacetum cinerariifolium]